MKEIVAKKRVGKEGRIKRERERVSNLCKENWKLWFKNKKRNTALTIKGDNNPIESVEKQVSEGVQDENKKVKGKGVDRKH